MSKKQTEKVSLSSRELKSEVIRSTLLKNCYARLWQDPQLVKELHSGLKTIEFANIKILESIQQAIAFTTSKTKKRLADTNLSNKQKAEILLIAQLEAHKIVDLLVDFVEDFE